MAQSISHIQKAYDLAANAYAAGFLDELSHKPLDVQWLQEFAAEVGSGNQVLDLGCGPGHTSAHLASLGVNPTGVDLSPEMISKAKSLFPTVSFAVGNFFQLSEQFESVPGILAFYCIVHLEREQLGPAFAEIFKVLKSGGVLFLAFHIGDEKVFVSDFLESGVSLEFSPFPVSDVKTALETVGFSKIEIHERPPYETEYPTQRCYIFARKPN